MSLPIKDILNEVLAQSGFLELDRFFQSTDPDARQMCAVANRAAIEIRDFYFWPELLRSYELNVDPNVEQAEYVLPDDFRTFVPESVWEQNGARQAEWPTPSNRWYMYKFSGFSAGGVTRMRLVGPRAVQIAQNPGTEVLNFEYLSENMVRAENGDNKPRFTQDTDQFYLWDQGLTLGIQAHWATTKMLPQAQQWTTEYWRALSNQIGRTVGSRVIGRTTIEGRGAPYYPLWRPN